MAEITRINPPSGGPGDVHSTVTPAELKAILGWLGLTRPWFAKRVGVQERTVIRWEDGDRPVPERAVTELVRVWNVATESVSMMAATASSTADRHGVVVLTTYRTDTDYWADLGSREYPASYHRALVCRTMDHLLMRTSFQVQIRFKES